MAAFSIGFLHTLRRPWEKRRALAGTAAPTADHAIEIRISDAVTGTAGFKPSEIHAAIVRLADRMLETRQPRN